MKLLVVGCGSIGARHARNAARMAKVAVVDSAAERAQALQRESGIEFLSSLERGLDWSPDAAIVATPHATHLEIASRLLAAGVPMLIEKPIADRLEGVDELLDGAERRNIPLYVSCNMRFHPGVATLHRHLAAIGKPYFARAHYGNYLPDMRPGADYRQLYCARRQSGGGVILDAIHEMDYLTWILGDAVDLTARADKLSDLDIDVEDYAFMGIRHATGAHSEIHLDYIQRFKRRGCELAGSDGTLLWSSEGKNPESCSVRLYSARNKGWETLYESGQFDVNAPYVELVRVFLESVRGHADPALLTGRKARQTLELALAARSMAAAGRAPAFHSDMDTA